MDVFFSIDKFEKMMLTDDKDIEDYHQNANRSKNEKSNSHHDHNLHHY